MVSEHGSSVIGASALALLDMPATDYVGFYEFANRRLAGAFRAAISFAYQ